MTTDMTINGVKASTLGVFFEYPTLEHLLSYAETKAPITNASRHIDGVHIDARNAKVEAREVELTVSIIGTSEDDFLDKHLQFENILRAGAGASGITLLGAGRFLWRLNFVSCQTLRIFADNNRGKYEITFLEPNPNNRYP